MFPLGIRIWANEKMVYSNKYFLDIDRVTKSGTISFIKNEISYNSAIYMLMTHSNAINGEIYEYDIIQDIDKKNIYIVFFDREMGRFSAVNGKQWAKMNPIMKNFEIIGNVLEEPELLKDIDYSKNQDLNLQLSSLVNLAKQIDAIDVKVANIHDIDVGQLSESERPIPVETEVFDWDNTVNEEKPVLDINKIVNSSLDENSEEPRLLADDENNDPNTSEEIDITNKEPFINDTEIEIPEIIMEQPEELLQEEKIDIPEVEYPQKDIEDKKEINGKNFEAQITKNNKNKSSKPSSLEQAKQALSNAIFGPKEEISTECIYVEDKDIKYYASENPKLYKEDETFNEILASASFSKEASLPSEENLAMLQAQREQTLWNFENQETFVHDDCVTVYYEIYYDENTNTSRYSYTLFSDMGADSCTCEFEDMPERQGVLNGLIDIFETCDPSTELIIITSNQYISLPFNKGLLVQWANSNWEKSTTGTKIAYYSEWQQVYNLSQRFSKLDIQFVKERGESFQLVHTYHNAKNNISDIFE